jgi:shikimate dehydrogenase
MSSALRPPLSGHTRVVGVIGDPVTHSLSPTLHNAAFEALGLDWVYVAFPVPRGRGADAVAAVPALGLAGLNVTMPHKEDVAGACHELTADAAALRSVNTVVALPDGRTLGDSTDGPGFLDALADEAIGVAGQPVLVVGAGGAARAIVLALGRAGAAVTVAARRPDATEAAAALAPGARALPIGAVDPSGFAVVVNATPLGMSGGDPLPVDPESLHGDQAVVDLVYHPADTPLLTAARAQGANEDWPKKWLCTASACSSTRPPGRSPGGPVRPHLSRPCGPR